MNKPTTVALIAAAFSLCAGMAQAANFSKSVYDGAKDDIKKTYKVDKDSCDKLSGNAKDICVEEAKGRATEEGNKIVAAARVEADQQTVKAREVLREQVAALAVKGAEQILRKEVNPAVHAELLGRLKAEL